MATKPPRFTDSTTVVGKAPPVYPGWVDDAATRSAGMDFSRPGQLGNAWSDQYSPQGRGFGENYTDPLDPPVYRGPINAQGQRVESDGDPTIPSTNPINNAPLAPSVAPSNKPGMITPTRRVGMDTQGRLSMVPYAAPDQSFRDSKGQVKYYKPPSNWDRAGRAVVGLFRGPDLGNGFVNALGNKVARTNPITGYVYSGLGAYQGARSDAPVTKKWNPNDEALQQALNDPNAGRGQGEDAGDGITANQATMAAGRNAPNVSTFSSGVSPNTFSRTQSGGGEYNTDPNAPTQNTGQNTGPQPTTPTSPTNPNTPPVGSVGNSPLPTPPVAAPPATTPPAVSNPQNRVNPQTGDPDPNGILPQHMPGYQPPPAGTSGVMQWTQENKKALDNLYLKYYGRVPTEGEVAASRGNSGGLAAIEATLKADTKNHVPGALDPPPGPGTGTGTNQQGSQTPGTNAPQTGAGSGGGGYSYAGFDFAQDPANRDISKSAKYAFSHFAGQAAAKGVPQPRNKQEAQAWFEQHIAPGMNANGFTVHKVVGDKAFISTREFPQGQWVDFQGNSGGQGDQPLTWQAENTGQPITADAEALYAVTNDTGGGTSSGMDRGEDNGVGQVLDSGNPALDSFAQRLLRQLLEGAALDDVLEREQRTNRGLTPASLAAVGF